MKNFHGKSRENAPHTCVLWVGGTETAETVSLLRYFIHRLWKNRFAVSLPRACAFLDWNDGDKFPLISLYMLMVDTELLLIRRETDWETLSIPVGSWIIQVGKCECLNESSRYENTGQISSSLGEICTGSHFIRCTIFLQFDVATRTVHNKPLDYSANPFNVL